MNGSAWIAVKIDEENGSEEWWAALDERYPQFADSLRRNRGAIIAAKLWPLLSELPGFNDGPEFAPCPLIDGGHEGDIWAQVVGGRHAVYPSLA